MKLAPCRWMDLPWRRAEHPATFAAILSSPTSNPLWRLVITTHDPIVSAGGKPFSVEAEHRAHESFAALRRRAYLEIPAYLERLDRHVLDGGSALAVVGPSGCGKSALMAYWTDRHRRSHPSDFLITHYIGATAAGSDRHAILRRIMAEIKERYGLEHPIPVGTAEIVESFPLWLGHVQRERLVIAIDALDQIEGPEAASWLPAYLQPNVCLIVSSTESPILDELRRCAWQELHVEPLTLGQRREIVRSFLGEMSTRFTAEQVRRMSRDTAAANPLFLRTRLEELRRFDSDGSLNRRIGGYLAARDLDDLYQHVLERLETSFGTDRVRDVMLLVAASRRGLSARELAGLLACEEEDLRPLLDGLTYHLSKREGLYSFFHDYLRRAVSQRYRVVLESLAAVRLRLKIADYFAREPLDARRVEEEPWQLLQARSWNLLLECISALPMFTRMKEDREGYQLLSYWLALGERHDMVHVYESRLCEYEEAVGPGPELASMLAEVGDFLSGAGRYDAAERCCRRSLELHEQLFDRSPADTAAVLDRLVTILYHTGRIEEAGSCARRALAIREELYGTAHPDIVASLIDVGALLDASVAYEEAEGLLRRALAICERAGDGDSGKVAQILNNLGAIRIAQRSFDDAASYIRRAIEINERKLGEGHPEVASNMVNLAFILGEQRRYEEAERYCRRALTVCEKTLGPDHPHLAVILTNLGSMFRESGDLDAAEVPFRRALRIRERALGPESLETLNSMIRLGLVLKRKGEIVDACQLYAASLTGLRGHLGSHHPQVLLVSEALEAMTTLA